jgi:hypothetical protein
MNPAPELVRFPYEDTKLPGWWIPADLGTTHPTGGDPDGPRPTLLYHGGFDSTEEELRTKANEGMCSLGNAGRSCAAFQR